MLKGKGKVWFVVWFFFLLWGHGALWAGETPHHPARVVSLGPSLTEEIYLLGAGDRLVGRTTYCKGPPDALMKEAVGTVVEVDVERILALKPDLVLATSLTDPRDVKKLRDLGIRVVVFPQPKSFQDLCRQFILLGRLLGKEKEARAIVSSVQAQVAKIQVRVAGLKKPRVFVEIGARPLFTATGDSFVNDFIRLAGGINIAAHAKSGLYSREKVLEENPDVILIVTMGIVGEREKEAWEKFRTIKAVKEGRVYVVDSYKLCSPTPVTFVESLKELMRLLHPGLGDGRMRDEGCRGS